MIRYFDVRNLIVWDYEWFKLGNFYRYNHELILFATVGQAKRTFGTAETDVWRIRCVNYTRPRRHPVEKPIELMTRMITNSSRAGDTVMDCFMGSGTTGVACLNTGRNFIGIELNEEFYKIAEARLCNTPLKTATFGI